MVGVSSSRADVREPRAVALHGSSWSAVAALAFVLLVVTLLVAMAGPAPAAEGDLTTDQLKSAARIEGNLIAPCCWTQTVALHESQKAEEIKMQVRLLLAQGKEESEIMDIFVGQYGEQILAAPRASGFNWLAYLLPFAAIIVGLGGIAVLAGRWRGGRVEMIPIPTSSAGRATSDDGTEDLRRRLEEDLSHFDS